LINYTSEINKYQRSFTSLGQSIHGIKDVCCSLGDVTFQHFKIQKLFIFRFIKILKVPDFAYQVLSISCRQLFISLLFFGFILTLTFFSINWNLVDVWLSKITISILVAVFLFYWHNFFLNCKATWFLIKFQHSSSHEFRMI